MDDLVLWYNDLLAFHGTESVAKMVRNPPTFDYGINFHILAARGIEMVGLPSKRELMQRVMRGEIPLGK